MSEEIICPECSRVITSEDGVCNHGQAEEETVSAPAEEAPAVVAEEPAVETSDETSAV